jgi:polysaccharide biosynthesis protein PslG
MRLRIQRSNALWLVAVLAASLVIGSQVFAARSGADSPGAADAPEGIAQAAPSPTPGFGPIITAPPQPTLTPAAIITQAPTATPRPSATPSVTPSGTLTPTISPTPLPTFTAELMGIQINPDMSVEGFETMLWLAKRLGVEWVKLQFAWDILEPQQGAFSQTFYSYRVFVQRANQEGFKVMVSIAKAPDWARATLEEDGPPRDPADLASFITRMMSEVRVDLYNNSYFAAIEVWNEPNLRREWNGGTLSGAEYMRLFEAAYYGIRAGEGGHSVTVVTAGLNNPAYQNVAIGIHPYGAANPPDARWCGQDDCGEPGYNDHPTWFFLDTIEDYRAIMEQNGDGSRQLWATEFGWGTYEGFTTLEGDPAPPPDYPPYIQWLDQETQGHYIIRALEIAQSKPYMGPLILWNLNYSNQELIDVGDPRAAYALLRGGDDPLRPAFRMIEAAQKR